MSSKALNESPQIDFYSNTSCPMSRRVLIALTELGLSYKEVAIDINVPRPDWYLQLNPRGQVPTLVYNGAVLVESAIIVQFLADTHASHLVKRSVEVGGPLQRARIALFTQRFEAGPWVVFHRLLASATLEDKEKLVEEFVKVVEVETEPSLKDAGPFFGGHERLGLAEVLVGPLLLMMASFPSEFGFPSSWEAELSRRTPAFSAWMDRVVRHASVNSKWEAPAMSKLAKAKIASMAAAQV